MQLHYFQEKIFVAKNVHAIVKSVVRETYSLSGVIINLAEEVNSMLEILNEDILQLLLNHFISSVLICV